MKTIPITKLYIEKSTDGKSTKTETTWSEFPNGGKSIVEQILASKEKQIQRSKAVES